MIDRSGQLPYLPHCHRPAVAVSASGQVPQNRTVLGLVRLCGIGGSERFLTGLLL
jgi:hypothetical protein